MTIITIMGFPIKTKREKTKAGNIILPIPSTKRLAPKVKKNKVRKKSRKGRVRDAISKCSGRLESANPAINPPISRLKPKGPATSAATPKAHAILTINKSSTDSAT